MAALKKRMLDSKTRITDIKPDEKWSIELDDGTVVIRIARGIDSAQMTPAMRVVLALNDICCERGYGKVYIFVQHFSKHNAEHRARCDSGKFFGETPELFYVKTEWTAREQEQYRQMTPVRRTEYHMSRNGWVPNATPVLPFDLELQEQKNKPKVPEFAGLRAAPVTVYICHLPYVGLTHELRALCERQWNVTPTQAPVDCRFRAVAEEVKVPHGRSKDHDSTLKKIYQVREQKWQEFDKWKVDGLGGILDRLDELYHETIDGTACVVHYIQLKRWHMLAARQADEMGQPYSLLGNV